MSSSIFLDASAAAWLAGLDPALTLLPRVLPPATTGRQWLLHDVRWTPGEGCRLAYRVTSRGSMSRFVAVEVTRTAWSQHDYREDARLPGLSSAAHPAVVADLLGPLMGATVRGCRIEPVRYRAASRCVLRYDVETASEDTALFAKAFRPEGFAEVASVGAILGAASDGVGLVPEVKAVWPELQVIVGTAIDGRAASSLLGDPTVPAGERIRLGGRVGDLLARFHAQIGVNVPSWSADDQVAVLADSMGAARWADARLGNRLSATLDVLADAAPASGSQVLGHGAFRAGQVVVSGDGQLIVLDTDGVCRCDPARDLGTVLAHLRWQCVRQPRQRQTLLGAERALLSGYETRAGRVDPESLLWWRVAGLLQVAVRRFRRLELQSWPLVHVLADQAEGLLVAHRARSAPRRATALLDTGQMSTILRLALAPIASAPQALEVDSAEELATADGRRSVVRYTIRGLDGADAVPVVAKVFADSRRARLLHDHLRVLHAGPFGHGDLRVPEPLGLLPDQGLVLYRPSDGVPLDRVADPARAEEGAREAARWLARLHSCDVRLARRFSLAQEAVSTIQWARLIGQVSPHLAGPARRLAERWVTAAESAAVAPDVPIHKDYHAGHVLVGEGVCVIDLDEARWGDPAFDVAHFCTYLGLRDNPASGSGVLFRAFVEEYTAATDWVDKGSYAPFCAYSWLKIAKQWAVGSGPCQGSPPRERLAGTERALAMGAACLSE